MIFQHLARTPPHARSKAATTLFRSTLMLYVRLWVCLSNLSSFEVLFSTPSFWGNGHTSPWLHFWPRPGSTSSCQPELTLPAWWHIELKGVWTVNLTKNPWPTSSHSKMKADIYTKSTYTPLYVSIVVWDKSFHKHINATVSTVSSIHKCFEDKCHNKLTDRSLISTVTHGTCKSSGSNSLMRFVESSVSFASKASMAACLDASLRFSIILLNKGTFACIDLPIWRRKGVWIGNKNNNLYSELCFEPIVSVKPSMPWSLQFEHFKQKQKTLHAGLWHCP